MIHLDFKEDKFLQTLTESDNSYCSNYLFEPQTAKRISKKVKEAFKNSNYNHGRWTDLEHKEFIKAILKLGKNNWKKLKEEIPTRSSVQIRSHAQKFLIKLLNKYHILSNKLPTSLILIRVYYIFQFI